VTQTLTTDSSSQLDGGSSERRNRRRENVVILARVSSHDRSRVAFKVGYAVRHRERIVPYARRWVRDLRLRPRRGGHVGYYRRVMRSNSRRSADFAVGSPTRELWLQAGQMQFDYLRDHGLEPHMRILEIGCGNLRAGRLLTDYLDPGSYYGIDISPEILVAALETIAEFGLQSKAPRVALVGDLKLGFLPEGAFDVVYAHSVFSHAPIEVIDECLEHVGRVMAPGGFFDFTFDRTDADEHQVLREDFYYRTETLTALAASKGFEARLMDDWEPLHRQSKLRLTRLRSPR
jgi:SAM-dependent methyltransferase